jgi:hypothetical protein
MRSRQALAFWNAFCLVSDAKHSPWLGGSSSADVIDEDTTFEAAYFYLEEHENTRDYVLQDSLLNFLLLCYEASK